MSALETLPGHLIRRLHQISVSVFSERMKALGVDLTAPQFAALSTVAQHPGLDQATLAGLIAHDKPTLGGVIERLEGKGLVARRKSDSDRRSKHLEITEAGAALLRRLSPVVAAVQRDILPGLTDDEYSDFIRLARKAATRGNDLSRSPLIDGRKA